MAYDVLVIGGGPAGLSAAQNVRARGKTALVVSNPLEENPLWKAKEVDNYLGLPRLSGAELLTAFRRHAGAAGAEFQEGKALSALRSGEDWYVSVGNTMAQAKAVVLAAGVAAIEGNTSQTGSQSNGGEVCRKIRPYNQIVGVVRPAFEEEDDMNIDKLTDAEVLALGKRLLAVMGKQPVSPALAAELAEAKARGITDGSSPGAFCTRAQAAVMTLRAVKD